ncbi:MAG: lipocalin-like domain-containing protein [Deltaproteobacteria bacterium]|nr:lipocalin-like domain-containing protein [Deltaproteobacteria bacterium]
MVKFKWLAILGLFLIALQPSFAGEREKILGVWKLVSWEREVQKTGTRLSSFGKNPTGYRIFTPEGRMMVIVTAEGRKAANTENERAALLDSMFAATGIYRVEGDKFITKIDVAGQPARVGAESEYSFRFEGDRLQLIGGWMPATGAGRTGRMGRSIETWERAK